MKLYFFLLGGFFILSSLVQAQGSKRRSLLDNDPQVVYTQELTDSETKLMVLKSMPVFATKNGRRKLGYLKANRLVTLEGFTEKAFKIRGEATHAGVAGWVSPKAFEEPEPDFVERMKETYYRQMEVRELIAAKQVAIGMTAHEVQLSLGEPTKTHFRQTKEGVSGKLEFIEYEELKHYEKFKDPLTGQTYRRYTHTTLEEKSKVSVEFTDSIATAIERSTSHKGGPVKVIHRPCRLFW